MDERGDVGSWIRITSIQGLRDCAIMLLQRPNLLPSYLPPEVYHAAVAGILKQGVERLDNVRAEAGACMLGLLMITPPTEAYAVEGGDRMRVMFLQGWVTGIWGEQRN